MNINKLLQLFSLAFNYYKTTAMILFSISILSWMFIPDSDPRIKLSTLDESKRAV